MSAGSSLKEKCLKKGVSWVPSWPAKHHQISMIKSRIQIILSKSTRSMASDLLRKTMVRLQSRKTSKLWFVSPSEADLCPDPRNSEVEASGCYKHTKFRNVRWIEWLKCTCPRLIKSKEIGFDLEDRKCEILAWCWLRFINSEDPYVTPLRLAC